MGYRNVAFSKSVQRCVRSKALAMPLPGRPGAGPEFFNAGSIQAAQQPASIEVADQQNNDGRWPTGKQENNGRIDLVERHLAGRSRTQKYDPQPGDPAVGWPHLPMPVPVQGPAAGSVASPEDAAARRGHGPDPAYGDAGQKMTRHPAGLGATPIDYRSEDFGERMRELTADGVDAAFDPIGGENSKRSFKSLKRGGTLAAYGFSDNAMGKGGSVPLEFMLIKLWDIVPNGRSTVFYSIGALRKKHPDWFRQDLTELLNLLAQGKIRPVVAERMPLAEAARAHELVERAAVQGKIVLMVSTS